MGANLQFCGQKNLQICVGKDDGRHIPPVGDESGGGSFCALQGEEFGAKLRQGGDLGGALSSGGGGNFGVGEEFCEGIGVFGEFFGGIGDGFGRLGVFAQSKQGGGAIDGAGVQTVESEFAGQQGGNRALAGGGGGRLWR